MNRDSAMNDKIAACQSEDLYRSGKPFRLMVIRPPAHYQNLAFPDGPRVGLPLGPLYVASIFNRELGYETQLLDALVHADLENLYKQSLPVFFGMPVEEIAERVADFRPDVVAVSSNFGFFLQNSVDVINAVKKKLPDVFVVAGGADVTAQGENYFAGAPGLDAAVLGEGEVVMKNLVGRLRHGQDWRDLKGLLFPSGETFVKTEPQPKIYDLDTYYVDYSMIDMEEYFRLYEKGFPARVSYEYPGSHRAVSMVSSRGCPYKCIFCSIQIHMGHAFRWHGAEYIVNELKTLVNDYDVRHVHFEDDNLTLHKPRFKKILRGIVDNGLDLTWDTPNGVRADLLDREMIQLCKDTGCVYLMFGVESGNQRVVNEVVKKDLDLAKVRESAKLCHEVGLDTAAFYIIGFPGETKAEIQDTYDMAFDLFTNYKTRPHFNIARPLQGTELYRIAQEQNLLVDTTMLDSSARAKIPSVLINTEMLETKDFTVEDLSKVFLRYQKNFLKQSIRNWFEALRKNPLRVTGDIVKMGLSALTHPVQAKTIAYRYYIRKFIFPYALLRDFAAASKPVRQPA